jgi:hypothetical protein
MGAREYDPSLGRWLSADSIVPDYANPQSWNRYSYVYNNPLKHVDSGGHTPVPSPMIDGLVGAGGKYERAGGERMDDPNGEAFVSERTSPPPPPQPCVEMPWQYEHSTYTPLGNPHMQYDDWVLVDSINAVEVEWSLTDVDAGPLSISVAPVTLLEVEGVEVWERHVGLVQDIVSWPVRECFSLSDFRFHFETMGPASEGTLVQGAWVQQMLIGSEGINVPGTRIPLGEPVVYLWGTTPQPGPWDQQNINPILESNGKWPYENLEWGKLLTSQ